MRLFGKSKTDLLAEQLAEASSKIEELQNAVTVSSGDVESMMDLFNTNISAHGEPVNRESVMKVSAVYACVRLLAGSIGTLPAQI